MINYADLAVLAEDSKISRTEYIITLCIYLVLVVIEFLLIRKAKILSKEPEQDEKTKKKILILRCAAAFFACGAITYLFVGGII